MKNDPITPWFEIIEELDDYIGIRFGHIPAHGSDPEWTFVSHLDFDGIGGFAELLRRRGAVLPKLPQIKHPAPPSWRWLVKFLPKALKPRRKISWGKLGNGAKGQSSRSEPPPALAWHVFDEHTTTQVRRVCRKNGFTVNSFLVKHLTKAIRPSLQDEASVVPWGLPINVRGKILRDRDTANYATYVSINVASFETVHDIHKQIYGAMGRGEHWANWHTYALSNPLPRFIKKWLVKKHLAMSQWNVGSFSNLGDWDAEKNIQQHECDGSWVFTPPVFHFQHLGAGCVTFQNKLSIAIQAHPELTIDPAVTREWVANWVKEIEMDVASVLSDPPSIPSWR
jgi:hypothetical protein